MREYFERITAELFKNIKSNELLIVNFDAEQSNFVRLNKAKIRQGKCQTNFYDFEFIS